MSGQDLIKQHKQDKCSNCKIKNCNGIHITIDRKTKCDRDEKIH